MYLFHILCTITCISSVETSISQIGFNDKSDTICVYLYQSIIPERTNALEVYFNINLEVSICHLNDTIKPNQLPDKKEILIIPLSDDCSFIEQLTILKNSNYIKDYFAILFSINPINQTFEYKLLSYLYNQIKFSNLILNDSFGFIDLNNIKSLSNQTNSLLYRINRENIQFDPTIFLVIAVIIISMLIGNEWHRRSFIEHKHFLQTYTYKDGLIIGFLLLSCFVILYVLDRYTVFIIQEIYQVGFMIISVLMVYLCVNSFCSLLIGKTYGWIVLFIVFILIGLWFLNRFTYIGFVLMNLIMFCITIRIISQMRVGNLMICMIIFGCIFIFEGVLLMIRELKGDYKRQLIMINPGFIVNGWTRNEDIQKSVDAEESFRDLYMNMFDNSGLDCILSGGSMNILKITAVKWIIKENLPFVFSFPRFIKNNDGCGFHTGRMYLSIDDLIFPSLLINFCRLFDIRNKIPYRIYYIQVFICYIGSFLFSYAIMIITRRDQLSSIIIYPIIVISTIVTGLIRSEFRKLLKGTLTTYNESQKEERGNSF